MKCPTCKKETDLTGNPYRPFCSDRCRLIDLGRWLGEDYRVHADATEESPSEVEDEDEEPVAVGTKVDRERELPPASDKVFVQLEGVIDEGLSRPEDAFPSFWRKLATTKFQRPQTFLRGSKDQRSDG